MSKLKKTINLLLHNTYSNTNNKKKLKLLKNINYRELNIKESIEMSKNLINLFKWDLSSLQKLLLKLI